MVMTETEAILYYFGVATVVWMLFMAHTCYKASLMRLQSHVEDTVEEGLLLSTLFALVWPIILILLPMFFLGVGVHKVALEITYRLKDGR